MGIALLVYLVWVDFDFLDLLANDLGWNLTTRGKVLLELIISLCTYRVEWQPYHFVVVIFRAAPWLLSASEQPVHDGKQ